MEKKVYMQVFLTCIVVLLCGCGRGTNGTTSSASSDTVILEDAILNSAEAGLSTHAPEQDIQPVTNTELYDYMIEQWMRGDVSKLYAYASDEIKELVNVERFNFMFMTLNSTFGDILEIKNESVFMYGDIAVHTATLVFENVEADIKIYIEKLQIVGYNSDVRFQKAFDRECQEGIIESYFLLKSGDYLLNAVYTHTDNSDAPSVLLIPGSGVSDYNETIGLLPTFEDIALELAKRGVNSLRFEKRTNRYPSEWTIKSGLDEEYFIDCNAALEWLKKNNETGEIFVLGHSLGVQIAVSLAEQNEVSGLILFNGSARHLAEIAKDQYCDMDPANSLYYQQLMDGAMNSTWDTAKGLFYFNCSDFYWADYNSLSTIDTLRNEGTRTLIVNSLLDHQLYDADIELWQKEFAEDKNVTIMVYDDISHFGYKIDTLDPSSIYNATAFPNELADTFAEFCK
ncbi:MAG: hypothetical protein ACI4HQ_08240 [Acetatifactor sp.]